MLTNAAMNINTNTNIKVTPNFKLCGKTQYAEMKNPRMAVSIKLLFNGAGRQNWGIFLLFLAILNITSL
jgi:hypothetical protein